MGGNVVEWFRVKYRNSDYSQKFEDISDESEHKLELKKEELEDGSLEFILQYHYNKEKKIPFKLKFEDSNNTGLVLYSYDINDLKTKLKGFIPSNSNIDEFIDSLFNICYHNAKDIYHEHEVQKESDGRLKAYFKVDGRYITDKPDINQPNNAALGYYIEQYENLFYKYAHTFSKSNKELSEKFQMLLDLIDNDDKEIKDWSILLSILDGIEKALQELDKFNGEDNNYEEAIKNAQNAKNEEREFTDNITQSTEEKNYSKLLNKAKREISTLSRKLTFSCNNALTEYNYCETLLSSVCNTEYKCDLSINENDENIKNRHREITFNIQNSVRYIEGVRNKCNMWDNVITHNLTYNIERMISHGKTTNIISLILGFLGLIIGIIGLIIGCLSYASSRNQDQSGDTCIMLGNYKDSTENTLTNPQEKPVEIGKTLLNTMEGERVVKIKTANNPAPNHVQ